MSLKLINMNLTIILTILFIHWVADFICQSHEMSLKKSKSNWWLSYHVGVYSTVTGLGWLVFNQSWLILSMIGITFVTHWITDYFTSRWTSKLYAKGDIHNFFVVVGLDQFIHYTTLLLTYKWLLG